MIIGTLVLICIAVGCIVALFAGLFLRQKWVFAIPLGILASWACYYVVGLATKEYLFEDLVTLTAMSVLPIAFVAWITARHARKNLGESF